MASYAMAPHGNTIIGISNTVRPSRPICSTGSAGGHDVLKGRAFFDVPCGFDNCRSVFSKHRPRSPSANKSNGSNFLFNGVTGLCRLFGERSVINLGVFVAENFVLYELAVSTIVGAVGAK